MKQKVMIRRICVAIAAVIFTMVANAQEPLEKVVAMTDRECYLAGERLRVSVGVSLEDGTPSPSKVAYVEISDTRQMCAQAMVALDNGIGWGEIALSPNMHSGNYQITVYTRGMRNHGADVYFKSVIGIVNAERLSRRDDVVFQPKEKHSVNVAARPNTMLRKEGDELVVNLAKAQLNHCTVSLERLGLRTEHCVAPKEQTEKNGGGDRKYTFEIEGHIMSARTLKSDDDAPNMNGFKTRMVLVGQTANVYDGQPQEDGTFCYYTNNIYGTQPAIVNGYDSEDNAVQMKLMSPFAVTIPHALPELTVYCDKEELIARSNEARRQHAINEWLKSDTIVHSTGFMSSEPDRFYDLDDYAKFNTIHEVLVEFVKGIKRKKHHGVNFLYTIESETRRYSEWPALVLLDGMPVYDIDEILTYDAHLVRYVQIYNRRYTFGNSCCQGVISFITRKGRLSNYVLDAGSRMVSYAFPQKRPVFENLAGDECGLTYWNPCADAEEIRIKAPKTAGEYRVTVQWKGENGEVERAVENIIIGGER